MVKRWLPFLVSLGVAATAIADTTYEQAQTAYWHEDNATAFIKCVETLEVSPDGPDAKKARYLMEVLWTGKLPPKECQTILAQLAPARPWLAPFLESYDAESQTNWDQATGRTLEFIAVAPDAGWQRLAALQLCRRVSQAKTCPGIPTRLATAASRLLQMHFQDCGNALRALAERIIAQNPKPEAGQLRADWRRVWLTGQNYQGGFAAQLTEQIVGDYLAGGATNEAKEFAATSVAAQPDDWSSYTTMAAAFMNQGDAGFAVQLLRKGIGNMPVNARGNFLKYLPEQQEIIYKEFTETKDKGKAQTLSDLWRDGFLKAELKNKLAQEHYQLVLQQHPGNGRPAWMVQSQLSFPFPAIITEFASMLYVNDQADGTRMTQSVVPMTATNVTLASKSGGAYKNGDVVQYKFDLKQKKQWQFSLSTNKIVLEGLDH